MRQNTDCSHEYHRNSIHNNRNQSLGHQSQPKSHTTANAALAINNNDSQPIIVKLSPMEVLKQQNNLQTYEK
jgi:hypothetical protein